MKSCRITVMRITEYKDLMEIYENPIEHTCDMSVGDVFITKGCEKPDGFCDSAWETLYPFVKVLAEGGGKVGKRSSRRCADGQTRQVQH